MQMFHPPTLVALLFLPFALSACGETQGQRIATGALGGATFAWRAVVEEGKAAEART